MGVAALSVAVELSLYECLPPGATKLIPYTFIRTHTEAFSIYSYIK
jgi:hypothetical protein